ncbi:protein mak16 [Anaeramoeba flamelloides]|uniref:Protein MAK16 homolog n=1 Tax=Anaeramoeba flamelloides TaxID=1746091 RepID=A0ABQ8Y676_9EUKA|nr:protein mak16 [Anaeramoeba flamelloides]
MIQDDIIWSCVGENFCCFKAKTKLETFCRNRYNLSGICRRKLCPLANSQYATVLEHRGKCLLYMKTIERIHTPNKMWEKIVLPDKYSDALKMIDEKLQYFPKMTINKAKQRLTRIRQYLMRMRRMKLTVQPKLVRVNKKVERRERKRENRALEVAKIEKSINNELVDRLKSGLYDGFYNFDQEEFEQMLDKIGAKYEEEEEEKEKEKEKTGGSTFVIDEEAENEMESWGKTPKIWDMEDLVDDDYEKKMKKLKKRKKGKPKFEIEFEQEVNHQQKREKN